jgi:hypothetical protein
MHAAIVHSRRWAIPAAFLLMAVPLVLLNLHCSEDSSPAPHTQQFHALAGGGRAVDSDPFIGGPDGSGPNEGYPGIPDIAPGGGLRPIAFLDPACGDAPATAVIEDSTAWRIWWEANTACMEIMPDGTWRDGGPGRRHAHGGGLCDGEPSDSVITDPDSTYPGYWELPIVDFNTDIVLAVTLERLASDPRMLVIEDVVASESGTRLLYTVYHPGDDCGYVERDTLNPMTTAPCAAVLVPRPVSAPFTFAGRDTTYDCSWEPDPNLPLALYYTDAACNLGAGEQVLTTQAAWDAWVDAALGCDLARWDCMIDSSGVPVDSSSVPGETGGVPRGPGDPDDPDDRTDPLPPTGYSIQVDFTQFAILILRAGDQERWGGGVWLTNLSTSAAGTEIEYTVITPGEDCPPTWNPCGLGNLVNPTVAIRVPLPLPEPINWHRLTETAACDWSAGSDSGVVVDPGGVRTK